MMNQVASPPAGERGGRQPPLDQISRLVDEATRQGISRRGPGSDTGMAITAVAPAILVARDGTGRIIAAGVTIGSAATIIAPSSCSRHREAAAGVQIL
jgi:hypothetical protein